MQPIAEETKQYAPIFPPAYSVGDTTVYLFTDTTLHVAQRATATSVCYFCVMTQKNIDSSNCQNLFFVRL